MKSIIIGMLVTIPFLGQAAEVKMLPTPTVEGSSMSRLYSNGSKSLLSWVEVNDSSATLKYSVLNKGGWSDAIEIISGDNWFNNWADYPSVILQGDRVHAHWLEKTGTGNYDYRIRITSSDNGGKTWNEPFTPHNEDVTAEYGFVTMLPLEESTFITWLDGRNTKSVSIHEKDRNPHDHGSGGAMTLRAGTVANGVVEQEWLLDERVCDCCTTAAALTEEGAIVAYRDRSHDEIRDINVKRVVDGKWVSSEKVPQDNWEIAGCPVNGPSIIADGKVVALTWFTAADNQPQVKLSLSEDSGKTFSDGVVVSDKTIGRVDSVIHDNHVVLSYLGESQGEAVLTVDRYSLDGTRVDSHILDRFSADRKTGFPSLSVYNDKVLVAWNKDTVYTAELNYSI